MKNFYFIALTASVTILSACSKSKNDMNGEYVADFGVNASVRMFAASGEVKDQAVIQKYISDRQLTSRYSRQQQVEVDESELSLTISGDKYTIKTPYIIKGEQTRPDRTANRRHHSISAKDFASEKKMIGVTDH